MIRARRLAIDVALCGAAFTLVTIVPIIQTLGWAPLLRMDGPLTDLILYLTISGLSLEWSRTNRMIWRYVSFRDLLRLIQAVSIAVIGLFIIEFGLLHPDMAVLESMVIWSVALIWTATLAFLVVPRLVARMWNEQRTIIGWAHPNRRDGMIPILLTGEAERMDTFIRDCVRDPNSRYRVIGVFSEESRLRGSNLHGVEVLGRVETLANTLSRLERQGIRPKTLVLAKDTAGRKDVEHLLDLTSGLDIDVARLPRLGTFRGEEPVRPIALSDLLGRAEVTVDSAAAAAMVRGKRILVTGAGGSIGSELTRQIAELKPARLIVADSSEFNLYTIDKELQERFPDIDRATALMDVRDNALVSHWFKVERPQIVFHAAALKHVPLLELHAVEAVKTNVLGTMNIAEASRANGVSTMVTISTDKAVNPHNVMGATKRLAEAYCQGVDQANDDPGQTRFVTVRFGNVLGSAGSVVPLFQRQIEAGGPVTVTHPEITRYFMTIPEAVVLVLQAGAQSSGLDHERGAIYVLDMGKPVKIIDLARQMIRLSGQKPDIDIKIEMVGLRPGEKLYEEVIHGDEAVSDTAHPSIFRVKPRVTDLRIVRQQVQELTGACNAGDVERVLRVLKISVPEFIETGVSSGRS
jgi:O-antigen biosynthesis protein WbqV